MAVSPLIVMPASAERLSSAGKVKVSAVTAGSNGTPSAAPVGNDRPGQDLAEQMNADEKRKFVKGKSRLCSNVCTT